MSAANIFVTDTAVHVFADGACYEPDTGIVQGFVSKIAKMPHIQAVAAITGTPPIRMLVESIVGEKDYADFDECAARFGEDLRERVRKVPEYFDAGAFFVTIAGWSAKAGAPRAFVLNGCRDNGVDGFRPRPVKTWIQPHDAGTVGFKFDEERAEDCGLRLLEAQRRQRWSPIYSKCEFHAVGGFAEYTKLTQSEITTKVIHRWPDRIGEKINPFSKADEGRGTMAAPTSDVHAASPLDDPLPTSFRGPLKDREEMLFNNLGEMRADPAHRAALVVALED